MAAPLIVAHRGSSKAAPENTLPAFTLAWEQGADAIEGDFRLTRDGHIVCIHDNRTKRVSDENLVVDVSTLAKLRKLDVGAYRGRAYKGTHIPTLDDVLATVPPQKMIYIEVKCGPEIVPVLCERIAESALSDDQVAIISFDQEVIAAFKAKAPQFKAYWLCSFEKKSGVIKPALQTVMDTLTRIGADGLDSNTAIPRDVAEAVMAGGFEWHVYTINDPVQAQKFAEWGAKSITSDVPEAIKTSLTQGETITGDQ